MQMADNAGATDADRAVNYCALRYPAIYAKAADSFAANSSLTSLEVRLSPLSDTRKIVEVIFSYTNRGTDLTEKFFVRVDVTEEFHFLGRTSTAARATTRVVEAGHAWAGVVCAHPIVTTAVPQAAVL